MTTFILHADQSVTLSSKHGWWRPETLNSRPTFSIEADTEEMAKMIADEQVRARYENADVHVEDVRLSFPLVKVVRSETKRESNAN